MNRAIVVLLALCLSCDSPCAFQCATVNCRQSRAGMLDLTSPSLRLHPRETSVVSLLQALNDQSSEGTPTDESRGEGLGKMIRSVTGVGSQKGVGVGSMVVAGREIPSLGIKIHQAYEVMEIFDQGAREDGLVDKLPVQNLEESCQDGFTRYVVLYNKQYNEKPVVVTPEEVEIKSMQNEIADSVWMALPILSFWTTLCIMFAKLYNERYGGDFMDAMFRT